MTGHASRDHDQLEAILQDVIAMIDDGELERADDTYRAFDEGMQRHIRQEEELVFPAFERATGNSQGPTPALRAEHGDILAAMAGLRDALAGGRGDAASQCADQLESLLGRHHTKEERFLYPGTDSGLSQAGRSELLSRLRR